ncbi:GNAT family N-acetyltransferase [Amnibacterium kyonggiense]
MSDPEAIEYVRFEHDAPAPVWAGVADVYVQGFASAPYEESAEELRTIQQWGRGMLSAPGGRLVVALQAERVIGFVISEGLARDESWQQMLETAQVPGARGGALAGADTVIVQELAVSGAFRGQGVAKHLMTMLLEARDEQHAVLSVYGRATAVRAMYQRWGFVEIGSAPAEDSDDTMHLMHHPLPWVD